MLGQIARSIVTRIPRNGTRLYHGPAHFKPPTMNEVPVPQGSWKKQFDANQKKYNIHLVLGVITFALTIGIISSNNLIYLNAFPPKAPKN